MRNTKQYLIYLRKSRKDSELEELGIDVMERHEKTLLEHAKKKNLSIGGIYRELVSGDSISARPEMQKLLREVESGMWKGVLVMEVERLARGDTIDQGVVSRAFQYSDTLIITPGKVYNPSDEFDQEYFEFGLFMSRREYKTITRRMQAGRLRSIQDGFYVANIPPYGYDRVKAPDGKHFTLKPNDEATAVRLMFELYANKHYGYDRVCTELNQMGIKPRKSKQFTPQTIKDIIANPVYTGMLRWNWRKQEKTIVGGSVSISRPKHESCDLYQGIHPAIISKELFNEANSRNGSWNAPIRKNKSLQNPLAGLITCPECGRRMVRKAKTANQPYDTLHCPTSGCKTVSCRFDIVEDALLNEIGLLVKGYSGKDISQREETDLTLDNVLLGKQKEMDVLEKQRHNIYDLLETGVYTKEVFLERQKMNNDKKMQLSKEIEDLTIKISNQRLQNEQIHDFIPQCSKLLKEYKYLTVEQKNKALKLLIKGATYHKTERNHWGKSQEASFNLKIKPFIPFHNG